MIGFSHLSHSAHMRKWKQPTDLHTSHTRKRLRQRGERGAMRGGRGGALGGAVALRVALCASALSCGSIAVSHAENGLELADLDSRSLVLDGQEDASQADVCIRFDAREEGVTADEWREHFLLSEEDFFPPRDSGAAPWKDAVRTFVRFFQGVKLRRVGLETVAGERFRVRAIDGQGRQRFDLQTVGGSMSADAKADDGGVVAVDMADIHRLEVTASRGALSYLDWCERAPEFESHGDAFARQEDEWRQEVTAGGGGSCLCLGMAPDGSGYTMVECDGCREDI